MSGQLKSDQEKVRIYYEMAFAIAAMFTGESPVGYLIETDSI